MAGGAQMKRACDRCHTVKEKCRWTNSRVECERCHRLQSPCQMLRPLAKAGRKPRHQRATSMTTTSGSTVDSESSPSVYSSGISEIAAISPEPSTANVLKHPRTMSIFVDLDERETQILNSIPLGHTRVDQFLIGPSFRKCHQEAFARHLFAATPLIRDALIASSALIACEYELRTTHQDRVIGHKRAASAVSALRSLKILDPSDISTVLLLAISAVTFALHISGSSLAICRHSLHLVKPFYESAAVELDADGLAFVNCLINSETAECLFRGEVPTIRFRAEASDGCVDRFLGLAASTLPYLYDICKISHAIRHDQTVDCVGTMLDVKAIEKAVNAWKPTLPEDFASRFSQAEIVSLLAQARVFRWSILLIAHRLRFPYGTQASKGMAISDAILEELDLTIHITKRSVPCVTIPFIAACFELTDSKKRAMILEKVGTIVEFSEQLRTKIKNMISAFWRTRDCMDHVYWYDLPDLLPK